jgi:hypothetical protein
MTSQQNFGSPTWARTRDLRINSPSLYRLSYRGIVLTTNGTVEKGLILAVEEQGVNADNPLKRRGKRPQFLRQ